jgi:transporter family protein
MAAIALPLFFIFDIKAITPNQFLIVGIKSVLVVITFIFSAQALKHLEVSEFSPLTNLSPIFIMGLSFFLLNERVGSTQILGILITILGAYILELTDGLLSPIKRIRNNKYIHYLIWSLFFGALCAILDKRVLGSIIEAKEYFYYQRIIIGPMILIVSLLYYKSLKDILQIYKEKPFLVTMSALSFMLADYFYFLAVSIPGAAIALIITVKRGGTLFSTIAGGEFFKERNLIRKTVGCIIMLLGVFIVLR